MERTKTKISIFLLFLSPIMGEVLSGSTLPLEFIKPPGFVFLVLLYGCGTLLIREAKARWNLQWSVLFLGVAYGILEEGTMIQSFFNVAHADLGVLSGYGMYFGVQWPWAIMLILFHSTMSTLIPIEIADLLWPAYKNKPLLTKRRLILCFAGLIFIVIFWMGFVIGQQAEPAYQNYSPNPWLITGATLGVLILIWLAYQYRESRIATAGPWLASPFVFGVAGFLWQAANLILPNAFAGEHLAGWKTILVQVILVGAVLGWMATQLYHQRVTKRHMVYLIGGSILLWILLAPIVEFINGFSGMSAFVMLSLLLLILWSRRVLRGHRAVAQGQNER